MNFVNPQLYVVPVGNTLPTTGSTQNLTSGQVGIFKEGYAVATAGNAAAALYLQVGQGRSVTLPYVGTKLSDRIYKANITRFSKAVAQANAQVQISTFSNFNAVCGQTVSITLRLFSNYLKMTYANGLTRTVTVSTPCCACGTAPCTQVDHQALVDSIVLAINNEPMLKQFVVAVRTDYGTASTLQITANALTPDGVQCDPKLNPYWFDRMYFMGFAYKGPASTQDYVTFNACDQLATFATTQSSASYKAGESSEIAQWEKDLFSYNTSMPEQFRFPEYNGSYESFVTAGTFYDLYTIQFIDPTVTEAWVAASKQKEAVLLAVPTGAGAGIEAILVAFTGVAATVETASNTTTSSTTTSTTSHI